MMKAPLPPPHTSDPDPEERPQGNEVDISLAAAMLGLPPGNAERRCMAGMSGGHGGHASRGVQAQD